MRLHQLITDFLLWSCKSVELCFRSLQCTFTVLAFRNHYNHD